MKYIGTIIGALAGLLGFRNFAALLLGAAIGYGVDRNRADAKRQRQRAQLDFVDPLFELLGAIAKADGRVSEREIAIAERTMALLELDQERRRRAIDAFNRGKQPGFSAGSATVELRRATAGSRELASSLIDVLADTVLADGAPGERKLQLLQQIARSIGIGDLQLIAILAMKGVAWAGPGPQARGSQGGARGGASRPPPSTGAPDPYAVLGLPRNADNAQVKRAWRKLMSEHHPDRLGNLPEELKRRAQERASAINAAYDRIKQERGLK